MNIYQLVRPHQSSGLARTLAIITSFLLVAIFSIIAVSASGLAYATGATYTDVVTVDIDSICSMTRTDSSGGVYNTTVVPGQTVTLGPTGIKSVCNDNAGYSIYTVGYSGDSYTTNNTKLIGTNSNIDTGTAASTASTGASYWAMQVLSDGTAYIPTIVNGFDSEGYHVVPDSFTQVAKLTSVTDDGTIGSNIKVNYQIKSSTSQIAGNYTGKVRYVLVHPNTATPGSYTIAYDSNGGSGSMTSSTVYTFDSFDLPDSTFTAPSGYAFAGWCDTQDTSANPQTACSGTSYSAGDTISTPLADAGQTATLYAYWESTAPPKLYMQTMTNSQCQVNVGSGGNPTGVGDELTVYDRRDESDYTVRYINGNCWMTQNLRITGTISSTDSNFTRVSSFNTSAGGDLRGGSQTYTAAQSHLADNDDVSASAGATGGPYTTEQLGAWYNYCAASAGEVCSSTKANATQDICPAGWRLPNDTGNTTGGEMFDLKTALASDPTIFSPIYGGYYYNGSLNNATTYGNWWSSTANSANNQYRLLYISGSLNTSLSNKRNGFYIRCILSSS